MQIISTADGSDTLYFPRFGEHYHSVFGAITESECVFIQSGLHFCKHSGKISVFELGFGTGLNALLTCNYAISHNRQITYHTIEKYPIAMDVVDRLNYTNYLPALPDAAALFSLIHQSPWHVETTIHRCFSLKKIHADMTDFIPGYGYDVVFFDAFSPDRQPEMWTKEVFGRLYEHMNSGGILTTYCVKGIVKRGLKEAGFTIEKLPGPPGKREILRAVK